MGFSATLFEKKFNTVSPMEARTLTNNGYRVANGRGGTITWGRS